MYITFFLYSGRKKANFLPIQHNCCNKPSNFLRRLHSSQCVTLISKLMFGCFRDENCCSPLTCHDVGHMWKVRQPIFFLLCQFHTLCTKGQLIFLHIIILIFEESVQSFRFHSVTSFLQLDILTDERYVKTLTKGRGRNSGMNDTESSS